MILHCWRQILLTAIVAPKFEVFSTHMAMKISPLSCWSPLVAIHLGIGILLFAMVLLTTLFAFRLSRVPVSPRL